MNTCDECNYFDFYDNYDSARIDCICKLKYTKRVEFGKKACDDFEEAVDE